jgi:anti-anti-sigma factor
MTDGRNSPAPASDGEFSCRTIVRGDLVVLVVAGALDWTSHGEVHDALLAAPLPHEGRLAFDLRGLTFTDSTGIRLILEARDFAAARGAHFAVIRGTETVQRLLDIVGLADEVRMVDDPASLS